MLALNSDEPEPPTTANSFPRNAGDKLLLGVFVFVVTVFCLDVLAVSANVRSIITPKPVENPADLDEHFFTVGLTHLSRL